MNDNKKTIPADEEEHLIHLWKPFKFDIKKGYDYRRKGIIPSFCYYLVKSLAQIILNFYDRIVFGLKIKGRKNLKVLWKSGGLVICNHVHVMDCTFIDCALPHKRIYYTTLESNFKIPVVRHLIRVLGGVPIPTKPHCLSEFSEEMEQALKEGCCVCVYPESVLHPYYTDLRKFRPGAFKLAVDASVPVIPMVVTFRKPKGIRRLLKRKPCVTLNILSPVYPQSNAREECERLKQKCYESMAALVKKRSFDCK